VTDFKNFVQYIYTVAYLHSLTNITFPSQH